MQDLVGQTVGQYEVVEKLGRGGMANVYKAYHPGLAVHRALKVIRPDLSTGKGFEERFQLEARAVAGLKHPNIVQMHDFGRHGDFFYMVMEFVDGEDLKARIKRDGPIRPFAEALRIAGELASALGAAHKANVLHRDVKPDNVMLGTGGAVILTDFGIAKIIGSQDPALTAAGSNIGTPNYMAPELASGETEASPGADLYAVGVVLYEMLTAHAPFAADTPLAVLHRVLHDPVKPPREFTADIPDALQGVVLKSMAFDPAQRYPTAEAFREAAKQSLLGLGPDMQPQLSTQPAQPAQPAAAAGVVGTVPVGGTVPAMPPAPAERRDRGPLIAAGLALVLLALLGASAVMGWKWFTSDERLEGQTLLGLTGQAAEEDLATAVPGSEGGELLAVGNDSFFATDEASEESTEGAAEPGAEAGRGTGRGVAPQGGPGESDGRGMTASGGTAQVLGDELSEPSSRTTSPGDPVAAARKARREAGIQPLPAERFEGTLRFGAPVIGELDPEETVSYDIEIRRPTNIYFDIVYATRPAWYTLRDAAGKEVFRQGSDLGPFRIEKAGWYSLSIETEAEIPVSYEIEFRQVGS